MAEQPKIPYYDLRAEAKSLRLPSCLGRTTEIERIRRTLGRTAGHHVAIVGPGGVGKTRLLWGLAQEPLILPGLTELEVAYVDLSTTALSGQLAPTQLQWLQEAFLSYQGPVLLILEGLGTLTYGSPQSAAQWANILSPLAEKVDVRLALSFSPEEHAWLAEHTKGVISELEVVTVKSPSTEDLRAIVEHEAARLSSKPAAPSLPSGTVDAIVRAVTRFPGLGQSPESAIRLLDESVSSAYLSRHGSVTREDVERIVAQNIGIPGGQLGQDDRALLRSLPSLLGQHVLGQDEAIAKIVAVLQRSRLGLRSGQRPLGSFLILGPSGVGKTETAKLLAEYFYGRAEAFLRIDMSEFGQEHTVARLIGAPPGYVGSDAGGQLTSHALREPYSLVLLDEIEKAHPKIFDIFLQALDDGRLTSGQGETVDLTNTTFMATSNIGVDAIVAGHQSGQDITDPQFVTTSLIPELQKHFRTEFLNRFDAILVYKPLPVEALLDIAMLEVEKVSKRVARHGVGFTVDRETLRSKVVSLADPRFGARPVKRFIEEMCEGLVSEALLQNTEVTPQP